MAEHHPDRRRGAPPSARGAAAQGFAPIHSNGVASQIQPSLPNGALQADVDPSNVAVLVEVGSIAAAMPAALRGRVERLQATSRSSIMVVLRNGVRVNWGTDANSALKADIVLALLKRKPSTIDVSSPTIRRSAEPQGQPDLQRIITLSRIWRVLFETVHLRQSHLIT